MTNENICPECGEYYTGSLTEHLMKTRPDIILEEIEGYKTKIEELKTINDGVIKTNRRMFETIESIRTGAYHHKLEMKNTQLEGDLKALRRLYASIYSYLEKNIVEIPEYYKMPEELKPWPISAP